MKNIETFKLNRESIKEMLKALENGSLVIVPGEEIEKGEYHLSAKPDSFNVNELNSEDNWSEELALKEGNTLQYRGTRGKEGYLALWLAPHGQAYDDLQELRKLIVGLHNDPTVKSLHLNLTDAAMKTGYLIEETEAGFCIGQVPVWRSEEDPLWQNRRLLDLLDLSAATEEIFLNNLSLTLAKGEDQGYSISYDKEQNSIVISKQGAEDLGVTLQFNFGAYEEVNYNSPVLAAKGLVPPGASHPELIYDEGNRRVAVVKETLNGSTYLTYVLQHGQETIHDQITLGREAIHNEQLLAVLEHRFTMLNEELPHEANVKTLALLKEIKELQAQRYQERAEEAAVE